VNVPRLMRSAAGAPMDDVAKVRAAGESGADVLMVDLELAPDRRLVARTNLKVLRDSPLALPLFVRVAAVEREREMLDDLEEAVFAGLTGVILPDCAHPDDIRGLAAAIEQVERSRGLPLGCISIIPLPETALAIRRYYEILRASPRVVAAWFPGSEGGDLARDLGYTWTPEGTELAYVRSKVVLDARAAGIEHILDGGWRNVPDLDGFRRDTQASFAFGYTGRLTFDPSQAAVANEEYRVPRSAR
jgi:citrate lyase subunit beta/citryl-CoA lyase